MEFTRALRRGMRGEDVLFAKQKLLSREFYGDHITTVTHNAFGADTQEAVERLQMQSGLNVDGEIGRDTWNALFGEEAAAKPAIRQEPSVKALMLCTLALGRIGDVYVWGASGMADLSDGAIREKDTEYVRAIRFRDVQRKAGVTELLAHDCSGFISYLLRQTDVWESRRDCDGLWANCTEIRRDELAAGDFLFRCEEGNPGNKTHVGLYIGRGLVVHSKGRDCGVVLEGINTGGSGYWHLAGRCKLLYDA